MWSFDGLPLGGGVTKARNGKVAEAETLLRLVVAVALSTPLVGCNATTSRATGDDPTNIFVNCFCSDVVGADLCTIFKQKVAGVPSYRLADQPLGAGVGVHLVCRDTGVGIKGSESAVSVAYTVYIHSPNEIFVASAVMLVGKHQVEPTAGAILSTVGSIASANAAILEGPERGPHH